MKRNKFTNNWGLKIASFLFAIAVWLVVVNINDPSTSAAFYNVPVTIENADVISAQGKIYEVEDGTDTVSKVTVYGPRSILENMDKSDIVATADMNNLSSANTISIEFSTTSNNSQITDIKGSIESVKVSIENKKSIQLVLDTEVTGSAPDGYTIGDVSTDQNLVKVSGPESLVNQIETAVVTVDMDTLSGVTSDITTSATVRLYDEDGNEITGSTLTKNPESVIVTVEILPTKEVPLVFSTSGTPADGYALTGEITSDPSTILIAGSSQTLASVSEIDISGDELNVTGQSADMTTEVNISDYLPSGVSLVDSSDSEVSVVVGIEELISKEFTVDPDDVGVTNLPEDKTCVLEGLSDPFTVSVTGVESVVDTVTASSLLEDFDVNAWMTEQGITELSAGSYSVDLSFNLPDGVTLDSPVTATLVVTDNTDSEDSADTTSSSSSSSTD